MHYPKRFQDLLDECPDRVARISQIENWLQDNKDYYEWCNTIWSLTEHEEGSEEYAFMYIYNALSRLVEFKGHEQRCKEIMDSFPGLDNENTLEFWLWVEKHSDYYFEELSLFEADYQIYDLGAPKGRKHLTVPIPCYQSIQIFVHKEDFDFIFEIFELYADYLCLDVPFEEPKDLVTRGIKIREDFSYFPEEDEDRDHEVLMARAASIKILALHDTFTDLEEIMEWVEESKPIASMLGNMHLPLCSCSTCDVFLPIFASLEKLYDFIKFEKKYRTMVEKYVSMEKNAEQYATFYVAYYKDILKYQIPPELNEEKEGLFVFSTIMNYPVELNFTFSKKSWEGFIVHSYSLTNMAEIFHEFLTMRFNEENKTYFASCDFDMIESHFKDRLHKIANDFFESYLHNSLVH
jgi:hypothetical protein